MSTTLYFPDSVSAPVTPPAAGAEWEHINGTGNIRQKLLKAPDTSALATVAYTPDAADDLTDRDSMHRQYVSDPLAAQTISGNVSAQFQYLRATSNGHLFPTFKVLVISNDGTTVRATLLAITRDSTEVNTALRNCGFAAVALSSYACADGDRICVECGMGGSITSGSGGTIGHNGSMRWGCNASSGDLPVDDTQTGTTYRPWILFSNTLTWQSTTVPKSVADTVSLTETELEQVQVKKADTISLTENLAAAAKRVTTIADSLGLSEALGAVKVATKVIADSIAFTEALGKQVNKRMADTVALTEARVLSIAKKMADTIGLTEGLTALKVATKSLGDTLGISEALARFIGKTQVETVTLTEQLSKLKIPAGGGPTYIFKAGVVPVYVHPDPTAPGVVPMAFVSDISGVTRVHTIDFGSIEAGCVPMKSVSPGIGVVPVMEEP